MIKRNLSKIFGYAVFAVAVFIVVGMFFSTSKASRVSNYYLDEVFPLYSSYDDNDEYLKGYATANNAFYDAEPIYTFENYDNEVSDLHFQLNIYRMRMTNVVQKLYFFEKKEELSGYFIEIKDLKYRGEDLMNLTRSSTEEAISIHLLKVHLEFDPAVLPHVKTTDNAYSYTVNPLYPAIISDAILNYDNNLYATLKQIQIYYYPQDANQQPIEANKKLLFVAAGADAPSVGDESTIMDRNLDLLRSNYLITKDEVAGAFPTVDELNGTSLYYQALNLSNYNQRVALTTLAIIGVVIVGGYFMFGHRHVMALVQQKRAQKRLNAKKADSIIQSDVIEAEFEEQAPSDDLDSSDDDDDPFARAEQ